MTESWTPSGPDWDYTLLVDAVMDRLLGRHNTECWDWPPGCWSDKGWKGIERETLIDAATHKPAIWLEWAAEEPRSRTPQATAVCSMRQYFDMRLVARLKCAIMPDTPGLTVQDRRARAVAEWLNWANYVRASLTVKDVVAKKIPCVKQITYLRRSIRECSWDEDTGGGLIDIRISFAADFCPDDLWCCQ